MRRQGRSLLDGAGPVRYLVPLSALALLAVPSGCGGEPSSGARNTPSSAVPSATSLALVDLVAKSRPGVVEISGMFGNRLKAGSGIVVDSDKGFVLTNDHVVAGLSSIKASVNDGKDKATAVLVAQAPCSDLAVLALDPKPPGLVALPLGDSKSLRPGDRAVALGYPGSAQDTSQVPLKLSATQGTVSTNDVPATPDPSLPSFPSVIQHQAPLSPGNSGGPLLNERGEVIGVNTFAGTEPSQGQNYAISIDSVRKELPQLEAGQSQHYLGWSLGAITPTLTAYVEQNLHVPALPSSQGVWVWYTDSGSAAKEAKFNENDIISEIEDTRVDSVPSVCDIIQSRRSGQSIGVRGWELGSDGNRWVRYSTYIKVP